MQRTDWLAQRFEEERPRLKAVALRMLGSAAEADDAVQEAWIRLSRSDPESIENLGGWLTVVLSRVCLTTLQARRAHPEIPLDAAEPGRTSAPPGEGPDPEREALLGESIGLALLVVLDTLSPPERIAFVLHDLFGVPFEDIAPVVDRGPAAARQLASRARRRLRGTEVTGEADRVRHARVVEAFLAAARDGEFEGLLGLLDPDAVLRADEAGMRLGAAAEINGAAGVARFSRRARGATPALLDGAAAAVWIVDGQVRVVYRFTVAGERISEIELIADPSRLRELDLALADL